MGDDFANDAVETARIALETAKKNGKMADLHTHLLGMGDADFWVDFVMEKVIPKLLLEVNKEKLKGEASPFVDYYCAEDKIDHSNWMKQKSNSTKYWEKVKTFTSSQYTPDVVYTLKSLCIAFGLGNDGDLISKLSDRFQYEKLDAIVKSYTVYNAREQNFEQRFGITNGDIRKHLLNNNSNAERNRSDFRNCFTMIVRNDDNEDITRRENYQYKFTPEFHPRRYELKDCMYSQYLCILDVLLYWALDRYKKSGVAYVEFSVGYGDLLKRPWVYKHLAKPCIPKKLEDLIKLFFHTEEISMPSGVEFRYLIGLNRRQVDQTYLKLPEDKPKFVLLLANEVASSPQNYREQFQVHLDQLAIIKENFDLSRKVDGIDKLHALHRLCVGLDYLGDEYLFPHCPFYLDEFLDFLTNERKKRHGQFGFRYHCGEADQGDKKGLLLAHMGASCAVITKVLSKCKSYRQPPALRIGHGIAFRHFIDFNGSPSDTPAAKDLWKTIKKALELMKRYNVPIEVNHTSNCYLQNDANKVGLLEKFRTNGYTAILTTDNDGIWPCKSNRNVSVAAEIDMAIEGCSTAKNYALSGDDVENLVSLYENAKFTHSHESRKQMLIKNDIFKDAVHCFDDEEAARSALDGSDDKIDGLFYHTASIANWIILIHRRSTWGYDSGTPRRTDWNYSSYKLEFADDEAFVTDENSKVFPLPLFLRHKSIHHVASTSMKPKEITKSHSDSFIPGKAVPLNDRGLRNA